MNTQYVRLDAQMVKALTGILYKKTFDTVDAEGNPVGSVSFEAVNEFKLMLTVDKPQIIADGIDTTNITAAIFNYLNDPQLTDSTTDIQFTLNGVSQIVKAVSGVASITFNSAIPGSYLFKVNGIGDFQGNHQIEVIAT